MQTPSRDKLNIVDPPNSMNRIQSEQVVQTTPNDRPPTNRRVLRKNTLNVNSIHEIEGNEAINQSQISDGNRNKENTFVITAE